MRHLAAIAALAALAGAGAGACKRRVDDTTGMPPREYDPALQPYADDFFAQAALYEHPLDAQRLNRLRRVFFVDDLVQQRIDYGQPAAEGDDVAGTCTDAVIDDTAGVLQLKWTVSERHWSEVWLASKFKGPRTAEDDLSLRELVFHELGHCLLGLDHAKGPDHHIMSPAISDDPAWLKAHWRELVEELFVPKPAKSALKKP